MSNCYCCPKIPQRITHRTTCRTTCSSKILLNPCLPRCTPRLCPKRTFFYDRGEPGRVAKFMQGTSDYTDIGTVPGTTTIDEALQPLYKKPFDQSSICGWANFKTTVFSDELMGEPILAESIAIHTAEGNMTEGFATYANPDGIGSTTTPNQTIEYAIRSSLGAHKCHKKLTITFNEDGTRKIVLM